MRQLLGSALGAPRWQRRRCASAAVDAEPEGKQGRAPWWEPQLHARPCSLVPLPPASRGGAGRAFFSGGGGEDGNAAREGLDAAGLRGPQLPAPCTAGCAPATAARRRPGLAARSPHLTRPLPRLLPPPQAVEEQDFVLNLDTEDLRAFDHQLYRNMVMYPREVRAPTHARHGARPVGCLAFVAARGAQRGVHALRSGACACPVGCLGFVAARGAQRGVHALRSGTCAAQGWLRLCSEPSVSKVGGRSCVCWHQGPEGLQPPAVPQYGCALVFGLGNTRHVP